MRPSMRDRYFWLVLTFYCVIPCSYGRYRKEAYETLTAEIFDGYDKRIRPTISGGPTNVNMTFELISIISLDETSQVLSTFGRLKCEWSDEVLAWDSENHSGITKFYWPQDDLWLPDIIILNSVEEEKRPGYKEMPVQILNKGVVTWVPSFIFRINCAMDVTYYPFDTQICLITVSAKMSNSEHIVVRPAMSNSKNTVENGVFMEAYVPGGVWDLVNITVEDLSAVSRVTRFNFMLKLKRRQTYYVINIIVPVLFLSLTASLVFSLPADAGEKIGMSMTVLLAYAVYLTIIADRMPQTSSQVSLLACYLTILLAVTALGVVLSVFVLSLHHTSKDTPVGHRTEAFTRQIRKYLRLGYFSTPPSNKISPSPMAGSLATGFSDTDSHSSHNHQGKSNKQTTQTNTKTPPEMNFPRSKPNENLVNRDEKQRESLRQSFLSYLSTSTVEEEERETITWRKVAETVDRLLFLTFTCIVFLVTVILLPYMAYMAG